MKLFPDRLAQILTGSQSRLAMTRGSLGTIAVRSSAFALAFVSTLYLAQILGQYQFGVYSEAIAWGSVVAIVGTLGLDRFAVREVSSNLATEKWGAISGLLRHLPRYVLAFSCGGVILASALIFLVRDFDQADEQITFAVAILISPLMSLSILRQGLLQGMSRVVVSSLPEDIVRPGAFLILIAIGFGIFGLNHSADIAMVLQACALVVSFVFGTVLLRRYLPGRVSSSDPIEVRPSEIRGAMPIGMFVVANILLMQAGIILVGLLSNPDQVALFATAFKIAVVVGLAEYGANIAYQPLLSSRLAKGDMAGIRRLAPRVAGAAFLLGLPVAAVAFVFAGPLLSLFGDGFDAGETALRILVISYLFAPAFGQNGAMLTMSRNVRPLVGGTLAALGLNVVLNLLLVPEHGALGASWAWLVTLIFWNLTLAIQVRRHLGFWTNPLVLLTRTAKGPSRPGT